ncbi:hypothetical protein [uncultured Tenacibaculum sp.]|uniref:hypothetical protein n=1 Tax=uncultured Tenacibaculum sp. TaxID=174713 RepID=UPI002605B790|nr:hypothetical protein [uncultured Tenacibaculum sp.]
MILNFSFKKTLGIVFAISILLYMLIGYKYDFEVSTFLSFLYSFFILSDSIRYLLRRKQLVEIGELERFHRKYLDLVFLLLLFFLLSKLVEWSSFVNLREDFNDNFVLVVFAPQIIQFIIGVFSREMGTFLYVTDRGILSSMETKESYLWEDFNNYKIIKNQKLFRFEKKNNKYLFISYDGEYFENNRKEILEIIKQNLKEDE